MQTKLKIKLQLQKWIVPVGSRQILFTWYLSESTLEIYNHKDDTIERFFATQKTRTIMKINVSSKDKYELLLENSIPIIQTITDTCIIKSNQSCNTTKRKISK